MLGTHGDSLKSQRDSFQKSRGYPPHRASECSKATRSINFSTRRYLVLRILNPTRSLQDSQAPPVNRLEALAGNRRGQQSIRINDRWRTCFRWNTPDAYDVEIVDYH